MTKVTLWVPTSGKRPESWQTVEAYFHTETPDDVEQLYWKRSVPGNVAVTWNQVVKDFLESDSDWLWSVHDDVLYHTGSLVRLMSWNQPLVSALVFHRQSPVLPHIWTKNEEGAYSQRIQDTKKWFLNHTADIKFGPHVMEPRPEDALVATDFTSTSCTLIHRSVLEDMREDVQDLWFKLDDDIKGGGEDRNFFEHAKKAGFQLYVDRSCIAGHLIGDVPTGAGDFMMWESVSTFKGLGE